MAVRTLARAVAVAGAVGAAVVAAIVKRPGEMGGGETRDGEFSGAREASPEERAFHAQQFGSPE